jgi:hypothetical protein
MGDWATFFQAAIASSVAGLEQRLTATVVDLQEQVAALQQNKAARDTSAPAPEPVSATPRPAPRRAHRALQFEAGGSGSAVKPVVRLYDSPVKPRSRKAAPEPDSPGPSESDNDSASEPGSSSDQSSADDISDHDGDDGDRRTWFSCGEKLPHSRRERIKVTPPAKYDGIRKPNESDTAMASRLDAWLMELEIYVNLHTDDELRSEKETQRTLCLYATSFLTGAALCTVQTVYTMAREKARTQGRSKPRVTWAKIVRALYQSIGGASDAQFMIQTIEETLQGERTVQEHRAVFNLVHQRLVTLGTASDKDTSARWAINSLREDIGDQVKLWMATSRPLDALKKAECATAVGKIFDIAHAIEQGQGQRGSSQNRGGGRSHAQPTLHTPWLCR